MNNVNLIGRVGHEVELKNTQSGKSVCSFNLAVKTRDKTNWIKIVFWNNLAEIVAKYVKKGDQLGITGEINVREYEVDGSKRTAFEINANDITFVGSKKDNSDNDDLGKSFELNQDNDDFGGDLPF